MSRFLLVDLPLPGLKRVIRQNLGDSRGFLSRIFCRSDLDEAGWNEPLAQINLTFTATRATVRGMHLQRAPHAEIKLVSCIRGEVWDVAVDLRPASPTFLQWHGEVLSAENRTAMLIPKGFAHGFQALTDNVELLYCHSEVYSPAYETGVNPKDKTLAISWPLDIADLSPRDMALPTIASGIEGVTH